MFKFLSRKKEENLTPLSEEEIQKKLYGGNQNQSMGLEAPKGDENRVELGRTVETEEIKELKGVEIKEEGEVDLFSFSESLKKSKAHQEIIKETSDRTQNSEEVHQASVSKKRTWPEGKKIRGIFLGILGTSLSLLILSFFLSRIFAVGSRPIENGESSISGVSSGKASASKPIEPSPVVKIRPSPLGGDLPLKRPERSVTGPAALSEGNDRSEERKPSLPLQRFFTLQLCVYENEELTRSVVKRLRSRQLDSFYTPVTTRRGRSLFQVFVGRFGSFSEAQLYLERLKKSNALQDYPDSFIRPLSA